jgi:hypothetical protein
MAATRPAVLSWPALVCGSGRYAASAGGRAAARCYRIFLPPDNAQNGRLWPFSYGGEIAEEFSSWTTHHDYCKVIFEKERRPGTIAWIFGRTPPASEAVFNISGPSIGADFLAVRAVTC